MGAVDDSPVDRRVVELVLRKHCSGGAAPFHVTAVDSGKKPAAPVLGLERQRRNQLSPSAPAAANEQAIDIVLTDYCMPEMTGYDLKGSKPSRLLDPGTSVSGFMRR